MNYTTDASYPIAKDSPAISKCAITDTRGQQMSPRSRESVTHSAGDDEVRATPTSTLRKTNVKDFYQWMIQRFKCDTTTIPPQLVINHQ